VNEWPIAHLETRERQAIEIFVDRLCESLPEVVLQAVLFGSKARGDSRPWSDIDILIIVREESWPLRREISTIAADISLEYDVLIGPRVIGQERWERMKQRRFGLYQNIVAEGIPLTSTPTHSQPTT
jgi:predicted nucleotidyltransferase